MKKTIWFSIIILFFFSTNVSAQKVCTITGKITNKHTDTLIIKTDASKIKKIIVNKDGFFSDTLKIMGQSNYFLHYGRDFQRFELKKSNKVNLNFDAKNFQETLKFSGVGADINNFLVKKKGLVDNFNTDKTLATLTKIAVDKKINELKVSLNQALKKIKTVDADFIKKQTNEINLITKYFTDQYSDKFFFNQNFPKGKASPKFINYENNAGGTSSLDDFKGKYVYIDVWATWCQPCQKEIPFLEEIEKKYHDKNIVFISISVDYAKDHDKWKKVVKDKALTGVQLIADDEFNSSFIKDYYIKSIPRFILIDPNGNIINADAPRPSKKELIDLFDEYKI